MDRHSDPAVQLLADRAAVRDVILRYARAVDRRDFSGVAACFTPDVCGSFGREWRGGRDGLIEFISGVAHFHTTMHMMGNGFVEIDGDEASLQSYAMLTHHATRDDGEEWQYNTSASRYSERLVRGSDGWVICERGAPPIWAPRGATGVDSQEPAVRWLLDRAQLKDAMMQYALGVDLREYDRVRGCFASDFRAIYGDREFSDSDRLIDFIRGVEYFESTTHFLGTPLVEISGDEAKAETLAYITHRQEREGHRPRETMSGGSRYRDRWVREGGGWRIAERWLGDSAPDAPTLAVSPPAGRLSDDPVVQGLLDRAEIADLVSRTALGLDRRDYAGVSACFTAGQSSFARMQEAEIGGFSRTAHLLGNQLAYVNADRAQAATYVYRTHHSEEGDPASAWSDGALRWEDDLVRGTDGWRIERRTVESNRTA